MLLFSTLKSTLLDWPKDWSKMSLKSRIAPVLAIIAYWIVLKKLNGFRGDHISVGLAFIAIHWLGPKLKRLYWFLFPILFAGILYDSQRFFSDFIRATIHVDLPYLFDKKFFGIKTDQGILTPNEFLQLNTYPILDFITGLCYLIFIAVYVFCAAYFVFYLSRKGTKKAPKAQIYEESTLIMWVFFWVNLLGWSTYYWFPAAPPWYIAEYGLGPANLSALPNPAGCLRFDALFNTHFFTKMYGRSADVFGAIPSLHVAYPLNTVLFAFRFGALRIFSVLFFLAMSFAAVYLNHHYILDLLWGYTYAVITHFLVLHFFYKKKEKALLPK